MFGIECVRCESPRSFVQAHLDGWQWNFESPRQQTQASSTVPTHIVIRVDGMLVVASASTLRPHGSETLYLGRMIITPENTSDCRQTDLDSTHRGNRRAIMLGWQVSEGDNTVSPHVEELDQDAKVCRSSHLASDLAFHLSNIEFKLVDILTYMRI